MGEAARIQDMIAAHDRNHVQAVAGCDWCLTREALKTEEGRASAQAMADAIDAEIAQELTEHLEQHATPENGCTFCEQSEGS